MRPNEWFALFLGTVVTLIVTYFVGLIGVRAQTAMTLMIALNVDPLRLFGPPFSGDRQVQPDAFKAGRLIFENQPDPRAAKPPASDA